MVSKPVEGLDAAGVLDAVEGWHGRQRELEARTFVVAREGPMVVQRRR